MKIDNSTDISSTLDNILQNNQQLSQTCISLDQKITEYTPSGFNCPNFFVTRNSDYLSDSSTGCSLECPSPFLTTSEWSKVRVLIVVINSISLFCCICFAIYWHLDPERNRFPTSMIKHLFISLIFYHVGILIAPLSEMSESVETVWCTDNLPSTGTNNNTCLIQGLMDIFLKAFQNWWVCIVCNLYLVLVCGMKRTNRLQWVYYFIGYVFIWLIQIPSLSKRAINYVQGTSTCKVEISTINSIDTFVLGFAAIFFTIKLISYLLKMQRKFGISMTKAKIFSVKLVALMTVLYSSLFLSYGAFLSDPGFTSEVIENGYSEWRNCRYYEYLNSLSKGQTADYSSCKSFEKVTVTMVEFLAVSSGWLGLVTCSVLAFKGEYLANLLHKNKQENHTKKSSSSHEKGETKQTISQSNTKTIKKERLSVKTTLLSITPIKRKKVPSPAMKSSSKMAVWTEFHHSASGVFDYIIIGGGVAAGNAAREFIDHGILPGQLAIFSAESVPPYERTTLSKEFLQGQRNRDEIFCHTEKGVQDLEWYESNQIRLFLNSKIVDFDSIMLTVRDSLGHIYQASKAIIIATGCTTKRVPITNIVLAIQNNNSFVSQDSCFNDNNTKPYKNLYYLRTIEDAEKLRTRIMTITTENTSEKINAPTCLIIGGGYIGIEVMSAALAKGWQVTLVTQGNSIYSNLFPPEISKLFEEHIYESGVRIIKGGGCQTLLSDCGSVIGCRLYNGSTIKADITIVGIGSTPNTNIFKGKIRLQDGARDPAIVVDQNFQTDCPGVFAVGDVSAPLFCSYGFFQLEHAEHAKQTGAYVARYLMGIFDQKPLAYNPSISSQICDIKWKFFGDNSGRLLKIYGEVKSKLLVLWIWEGRIQGALVTSGTTKEHNLLDEFTAQQKIIRCKDLKICITPDDVFSYLQNLQNS